MADTIGGVNLNITDSSLVEAKRKVDKLFKDQTIKARLQFGETSIRKGTGASRPGNLIPQQVRGLIGRMAMGQSTKTIAEAEKGKIPAGTIASIKTRNKALIQLAKTEMDTARATQAVVTAFTKLGGAMKQISTGGAGTGGGTGKGRGGGGGDFSQPPTRGGPPDAAGGGGGGDKDIEEREKKLRRLGKIQIKARQELGAVIATQNKRQLTEEEAKAKSILAMINRQLDAEVKAGNATLAMIKRKRTEEEEIGKALKMRVKFQEDQQKKLAKGMKNLGRGITAANKAAVKSVANAFRNLGKSIRQTTKDTNVFGKQLALATRRFTSFLLISGGIFAVQRAMRSLVGTIIEVDDATKRLQRLLPGTTKDFDNLKQSAIETALGLGTSVKEVIGSMEIFARRFKDQATVARLAGDALLLTNISTQTLAAGTENLTATMEQFNFGAEGSRKIVDAWAKVSANAKVSVDDLGDAAAGAGRAALAAGLSFDEMNGLVASVAEQTNASGKEIAATMRRIFERLTSPEQAKKLQKLGVLVTTIGESGEREMRPFRDIIRDMQGAFDKAKEKGEGFSNTIRQQVATAAAGSKRYTQFLSVIDTWTRGQKLAKLSANSFGEATRQNAIVVDSLGKKMERVKAGFEAVAIAAGKGGATAAIGALLDSTKFLLGVFSQLPGLVQTVIISLTALTTTLITAQVGMSVFGSKVGVFKLLGNAVVSVIPKLAALTTGMRILSGATGIGLLITGVVALVQVMRELAGDPITRMKKGFSILGFTIREGTDAINERITKHRNLISSIDSIIERLEKQEGAENRLNKAQGKRAFFEQRRKNLELLGQALGTAKSPEAKRDLRDAIQQTTSGIGFDPNDVVSSLREQQKVFQDGLEKGQKELIQTARRNAIEFSNVLGDTLVKSSRTLSTKGPEIERSYIDAVFGLPKEQRDRVIKEELVRIGVELKEARTEESRLFNQVAHRGQRQSSQGGLSGSAIVLKAKLTAATNQRAFLEGLEAQLSVEDVVDERKPSKGERQDFGRSGRALKIARQATSQLEQALGTAALSQRLLGAETDTLTKVTKAFESGVNSLIGAQVKSKIEIARNKIAVVELKKETKDTGDQIDKLNASTEDHIASIKRQEAAMPGLIKQMENLQAVSRSLSLVKGIFKSELTQIESTLEKRRQGEHSLGQERININAEIAQEQRLMGQAQQQMDENALAQSQFRIDQLNQQLQQLDNRSKDIAKETSVVGRIGRGLASSALKTSIGDTTDKAFNALGNILTPALSETFKEFLKESRPPAEKTAENTRDIFVLLKKWDSKGVSGKGSGGGAGGTGSVAGKITSDESQNIKKGAILQKEEEVVEKQSKAANLLAIAGVGLQGALGGAGITAAQGKKGPGGAIGGGIGGIAGTLIGGPIGASIGSLLGGVVGSLFDKKVQEEFVQPLIPPLDMNTEAIKANTSAVSRLQTTAIEKIINAPTNFALPAASIRGGRIPSAQFGGFVERGGIVKVHARETIVPEGQGGMNVTIIIKGGSNPQETAQEVGRVIASKFKRESRTAGLRPRRL